MRSIDIAMRMPGFWGSTRFLIDDEVVLRDPGAAVNASALPHVDLRGPVILLRELIAMAAHCFQSARIYDGMRGSF